MNIIVIDATFLTREPNRERTLFQLRSWAQKPEVALWIVTSAFGEEFYCSKLPQEAAKKIRFIRIPWALDHESVSIWQIPFVYLRRMLGILFVRRLDLSAVIYTISPLIVDVWTGLVIKKRSKQAKLIVNYDNFVPAPHKRPGESFIHKLIPYVAYRITLGLLRSCDGLASYMSESSVQKLSNMFAGRKPTLCLTNGLDLGLIASVPEQPVKQYDIAYLGRIHPAKGIWDLLRVVIELKKSSPDIRVCLIGPVDAGIKKALEEFIAEHDLSRTVDMAGFVDVQRKYTLLKQSKIFVFFSYDDSSPVSVIEAIACKLPIVVYDLEIYGYKPFKQAYIKIFKKGDYQGSIGYIQSLINDYPVKLKEIADFYANRSIVISSLENTDKELNFFKEVLNGEFKK